MDWKPCWDGKKSNNRVDSRALAAVLTATAVSMALRRPKISLTRGEEENTRLRKTPIVVAVDSSSSEASATVSTIRSQEVGQVAHRSGEEAVAAITNKMMT